MKTGLLKSEAGIKRTAYLDDYAIERVHRSITVIALFNFFIVAVVGVLLRSYPLYDIPFPSFKNLLHAHSHFAFGGWVMPALLAMILKYFPEVARLLSWRQLRNICVMMFVSSYGMLLSFPFQGYAFASIIFSSLSIVSGFYLAYILWIGTENYKRQTSVRFLRAGLIYLTISALGPLATGPLIATGQAGTPIYYNSIYFFLHFQYNGWFTFAILSILFKMLSCETRTGKWAFVLMHVSCLPAFLLSTLWNHPAIAFNVVGGIAAGVQLVAVCLIIHDLTRKPGLQTANPLLRLSIVFFVLKNVLQLAGSFPTIAEIAYTRKNFTIAYLHMVLLGFVTVFLIGTIIEGNRIVHFVKWKYSIRLFITCFILSELLLLLNASGFNISIGVFRFPALILIASILLPVTVFMIWHEVRLILAVKKVEKYTRD